ncbi:hypothetical protein BFP72_06260 [Reichenbachiella sp. 5M10]|uniref:hypothetical protein n=1 Tax=Reichenbachiella sp. 5M10 TaxID=1889772 RepID=UPI000C15EA83|nr:hypothetical protein [Reichenbachiella sp. 5M10]PIB35024.1 hypothetical protein BFP72_06260 [Reichenbachiella sp. 5M10]
MEKPVYIETNLPENKGSDFYYLREEGIRIVQNLTGKFWTDYNEHDPGVTILEQVAYALTEVAYKAQVDIEDLLHSSSDEKQSFFRPDQVLPGNALTTNDYRKILFDSVFEIKNVWIFPISTSASNMTGLYKVLIDTEDHINTDELREVAKSNTIKAYNSVRNICEDIGSIDIVKHVEIGLSVDIEISGAYTVEEVMARVFFDVDNFLCPEIKFYSLDELLEEGYQLNDVFNGPLLKHGFIKSQDLPSKTNRVLVSEVMKHIMQVEGVSSVKNLRFLIDNEEYDNHVSLDEKELPRLKVLETKGQPNHAIKIYKGDVLYRKPNAEEVNRHINEFKSAGRRVYRLNEKSIGAPPAQHVDVKSYYSLQNQFPAVYGIGEEGVIGKPSIKRRAQANQLKGYLLLFEQVIANSLAQLAHVKDLLSFHGSFEQSYFTQELSSVPNVDPLLKKNLSNLGGSSVVSPSDDLTTGYEQGLPQIMAMSEDKFDRIQRLLDYLLSLHGETYNTSLRQFNYYFDDEEFEQFLNKNKSNFLKAIPFINSGRSKGYNYTEGALQQDNVSGLEVKVSILLGLNAFLVGDGDKLVYKKRSMFSVFDQHKATLEDVSLDEDLDRVLFVPSDVVEERFEIVDDEEVDLSEVKEKDRTELLQRSLFFEQKVLTPEVLVDGLDIENYRIGTMSDSVKSITVTFYSSKHDQWLVLGKFRSYNKAEQFVMAQRELIRDLNMSCEGMHLVEHLLLRPHHQEESFGLFILNERGEYMLGSRQTFTFQDRIMMSEKIEPYLRDVGNYSVEINKDRDFEIHFQSKELDITFESISPDPSVEKTHADLNALVEYLNSERSKGRCFDYFVRNTEESPRIPENFYSHRLSVLFPNWTARFLDDEYRRLAEDTINNEKPASVDANVRWLNFDEFRVFENLLLEYYELKNEGLDFAFQNEAYRQNVDQLTNLLFRLAGEQ